MGVSMDEECTCPGSLDPVFFRRCLNCQNRMVVAALALLWEINRQSDVWTAPVPQTESVDFAAIVDAFRPPRAVLRMRDPKWGEAE